MRNAEKLYRFERFMVSRNFSKQTIKTYKSMVIKFLNAMNDDSSMISKQNIQDYILSIPDNYSNSYRDQVVNSIKLYFKIIEDKQINSDYLPRPKKQQFLPNILTVDQVERVIFNTKNLKHKATLFTIYDNGLRISELLNLSIMDVRTKCDDPNLVIRDTKHHSSRIVYMSQRCVDLLREYYVNERPQPKKYLFEGPIPGQPYSKTSIRNIFNSALKREGIKLRVRVHDLRHSFATHCLESGTDIYHLSGLLGHKSVKTTESTYSHMQPNKRRIIRPADLNKQQDIKLRIAN